MNSSIDQVLYNSQGSQKEMYRSHTNTSRANYTPRTTPNSSVSSGRNSPGFEGGELTPAPSRDSEKAKQRQSTLDSQYSSAAGGVGFQNGHVDFFSPEVFQIVLHNPATAHRFLRFCQSRACGENMEFLEKVRAYMGPLSCVERAVTFKKDQPSVLTKAMRLIDQRNCG